MNKWYWALCFVDDEFESPFSCDSELSLACCCMVLFQQDDGAVDLS